jgi:hypothetical protein
MNAFAQAHKARLNALHKVKHRLTGEDTSISLLSRNETTGAMDNEIASFDSGWSKARIRPDFLPGANDGVATFVEAFEIAEDFLDQESADQVAAVKHGLDLYSVKIMAKPNGLQRFWRLQIMSVETVAE